MTEKSLSEKLVILDSVICADVTSIREAVKRLKEDIMNHKNIEENQYQDLDSRMIYVGDVWGEIDKIFGEGLTK